MPRSLLVNIAGLSGLIPIFFGVNCFFRPAHALSFFALPYPTSAADRTVVDALIVIYGARDIFMGLALFAAAAYNARKPLGWITVAVAAVAGVDGYACVLAKTGEQMAHWGYAPLLAVLGLALLR
ncbi:hypothetical protein JCM10207_004857 [Rhodosporidiobolus poonsookiae]